LSDSEKLRKVERHDMDSVNELAEASFEALGVRGFGRIDIKMDDLGICYFMEANLVPGMNHGTSYFPRACEIASEMMYDDVR
jgi:D-alanine-D-alanine ligase